MNWRTKIKQILNDIWDLHNMVAYLESDQIPENGVTERAVPQALAQLRVINARLVLLRKD